VGWEGGDILQGRAEWIGLNGRKGGREGEEMLRWGSMKEGVWNVANVGVESRVWRDCFGGVCMDSWWRRVGEMGREGSGDQGGWSVLNGWVVGFAGSDSDLIGGSGSRPFGPVCFAYNVHDQA